MSFCSNRVLRSVRLPNTACTRLAGFAPPKRSKLRSSQFRQSGVTLSRPPAGNANRWAEVERAHVEHGEKLKNMSHYEILGRELNNMLI